MYVLLVSASILIVVRPQFPPYEIICLTQAAAFALRHKAVLDEQTQANRAEGDRLFDAAAKTPGTHVCPSEANFILLWLPEESADAGFTVLKARGVPVKNLSGAHPMLTDCLRVMVGTPEENGIFLSALAAVL